MGMLFKKSNDNDRTYLIETDSSIVRINRNGLISVERVLTRFFREVIPHDRLIVC